MKLSIADMLESIRGLVALNVGVDVFLGAPDDSVPGMYIFPFHLEEAQEPINRTGNARQRQYVIRCMLMTSPSTDFETLGQGLECIQDNPVVESSKGKFQVTMSNASTKDQARVFAGSGIVRRLAVIFEVRMSG